MALHDFFLDRYALAARPWFGEPKTTTAAATTFNFAITSPNNDDDDTATRIDSGARLASGTPDSAIARSYLTPEVIASTLSEQWCLQYLNLSYVYPIQEAFDEDGSGYVRISEANDFCDSIPVGFSLLQWIAYWAQGWHVECARYAKRIKAMIVVMRSATIFGSVAPENSRMVMEYLEGFWWRYIGILTLSAASKAPVTTDSPLDDLVKMRMAQKEKQLTEVLVEWNYNVDTPESFSFLCGPERMEKVGVIQFSAMISAINIFSS